MLAAHTIAGHEAFGILVATKLTEESYNGSVVVAGAALSKAERGRQPRTERGAEMDAGRFNIRKVGESARVRAHTHLNSNWKRTWDSHCGSNLVRHVVCIHA